MGEWPTVDVVAEAQADQGWRPLPFTQFIIKLHGRCNLSCDYCYMYEMSDQSWRGKPTAMARQTIDATAARIAEHVARHPGLPSVEVVLHGGEPLLAGRALVGYACDTFRRAGSTQTPVSLTIQTNGVLLDDDVLPVLRKYRVRVGVSVDGDQIGHDRHRRFANGRGSYDLVRQGLTRLRLPGYSHLFAGLLCTVDLASAPLDVYESLLAYEPPKINFLLPLGNWSQTPPGWTGGQGRTAYADWLIPIFNRWYDAMPSPTRIVLFEEIMALALGGTSRSETVGLGAVGLVVIETDGTFELVDTLKSAFDGAPATGLDVFRHQLDDALLHPGVVARQRGLAALCRQCLACPVRDICGGGYYPHRYRAGIGFLNPSVYCTDLFRLINHIRERVTADVEKLRAATQPEADRSGARRC